MAFQDEGVQLEAPKLLSLVQNICRNVRKRDCYRGIADSDQKFAVQPLEPDRRNALDLEGCYLYLADFIHGSLLNGPAPSGQERKRQKDSRSKRYVQEFSVHRCKYSIKPKKIIPLQA